MLHFGFMFVSVSHNLQRGKKEYSMGLESSIGLERLDFLLAWTLPWNDNQLE